MAKNKKKYTHWATRNGREGPKVYTSWPECEKNTKGVPGVEHGGFYSLETAQRYIEPALARAARLKAIKMASNENVPTFDGPAIMPYADVDEREKILAVQAVEVKADIEEEFMAAVVQEVHPAPSLVTEPSKAEDVENVTQLAGTAVNEETVPVTMDDTNAFEETPVTTLEQLKSCDHLCVQSAEEADAVDSPAPPALSEEQRHILDLVQQKRNVFFTGSAGTGKSVLMRAIIGLWPPDSPRLAITASTGAASVHFAGGRTVHSWAGIGLGTKDAELLVAEIMDDKHKRDAWLDTDCLLIDEISMIDDELFDKLDYIGQEVRSDSRPFGGIQLVVSGDFFQLPPVVNSSKIKAKFAFEARSWNDCFDRTYKLTKVFRQSDNDFVDMLEEIKIGKISARTEAEFKYLARPVKYYDDIGPTELYPTNAEASRVNQMRLDNIDDFEMVFHSHDVAGVDLNGLRISQKRYQQVIKSISAPEELVVKKGARVMLIMNKEQGVLVNGSVGIVEDFCTIEEAETNHIAPFNERNEEARQRVKDSLPTIVRDPQSNWMSYRYPVVRFTNGRTLLCHPVLFKQENHRGHLMAGRTQVPLILAWALSIHKSQGATIERVLVDLSRVFERGQAYVALSRAVSMDTLQVLNFDKARVEAHPHVMQWMGLEADQQALEDEKHRRELAEQEYQQALVRPREDEDEDYFAYVDDIDEIDIFFMDNGDAPI